METSTYTPCFTRCKRCQWLLFITTRERSWRCVSQEKSFKQCFFVQIAAGENHLVMLDEKGAILTFGDGEMGQLGRSIRTKTIRSSQFRNLSKDSKRYLQNSCAMSQVNIWSFLWDSNQNPSFTTWLPKMSLLVASGPSSTEMTESTTLSDSTTLLS